MPLMRERAPGGHFVAVAAPAHLASFQQQQHRSHHNTSHHRSHQPHATTTTTIHEDAAYPPSPDTIRVLPRSIDVSANATKNDELRGQPPKKKRKLSIRTTNHKLESFGFISTSTPPKPPAKITRDHPHGQLQQTINGVKSALDVDEDELSLDSNPLLMPKRATRSPVPAPAPSAQPASAPAPEKRKKEERRSLRSHDEGPRLKSELAVYFPNYEDVMFDVPNEEEEFLTVDSTLYIAEDTAKKKDGEPSPAKSSRKASNARRTSVNGQPATPHRSASMSNSSPNINLDFLAKTSSDTPEDPLTDAHFLKSHNRAERKEKQLRNIERERAMHEKVQLERLLDGLQGHDWLRVLGVTGVTDGEAKKYESKRDYFVAEVKALIDKFAQWKAQEKKLRLRKEAVQARQDATDEGGSTASSVEPPSSDLNASAARQLQQETVNAVKASSSKAKGKLPMYSGAATSHPSTPLSTPGLSRTAPPPPPLPPSPEIPITSFYAKRHLRDAALSKSSRQTTRNITAFGHLVPDLIEQEFALPEDFVTPDALRANARERRRRKRESAANSSATK